MSRIVLLGLAVVVLVAAQTNEGYAPVALNACAATLCQVGTICEENNGVARCVPPKGTNNNCTNQFEEWRQCATCEPTCGNKNPMCNRMCQPARCMCRQGFFRSNDGKCVTENDCDSAAVTPSPKKCSHANEEYRECASACEPNCRTKDQERACIAMCKPPACQCKVGYFRNDNGECVLANQCPNTQCKKNEVFRSCSSMCEPQCGQYQTMACILMCGPAKCQCTSGFYRNANGECMTQEECEKNPNPNPSIPSEPSCKKNQVFRQCSSMCIPKCGEYEVRPCMAMCGPPKCECETGFYLDNHGECVSRAECDAQSATPKTPGQDDCKPNEIFRECSSQCEEKCGETLTRACPASCGPPKCQCDSGFFRNKAGECVEKSACDPTSQADCGPNMTFKNCSSTCNMQCGDYTIKPCPRLCGPPKCVCNQGFYFNSVGDCVNKSDCELDTPVTCANIDCISGLTCEMQNGKPVCINKTGGLTCATVKCAGGNRCEITPEGTPKCIPSITCANVRCAGPCTDTPKGPVCGPRPQVLPISVGPTANPVYSPCARKNCGIAYRCVEENGQAKCVPLFTASCMTVKCSSGHHCEITPEGTATCAPDNQISPSIDPSFPSLPDSCDQVTCLGGGTCVMEEVRCISGPCKPVPKCIGGSSASPSFDDTPVSGYGSVYQPFADNCSQLKCKDGEECTMERIPCFAPPCKKGAVCRPSNKICRKEHEVWDQCFHECGPTCQNRNPACTEQCGPGGCICDTFYIRDQVSGKCVRLENCPSTRDIPVEKPRALTITERVNPSAPPSLPPPPPTCDNFDCPTGQMCTLPPMACRVPPCTRRPTCVPDPNQLSNCSTTTCPVGMICEMVEVQCFVPPCYPVPECHKDPNYIPGDEIVPTCEGHQCPNGEKCQLQEVVCIRAPCYPIPQCVPDMVPPTCNLPCPYGQTCVLETVFCKKAPCPQKPSCRLLQIDSTPQTCAAVSCVFGEECVEEPMPCLVAPCPVRAICKPMMTTCEKKNEVWSQCFTGCEATCQMRMKACTLQCGPGGCQCDVGFIRDERNGECVSEKECPNPCGSNEEYDKCYHGCEPTCLEGAPFCTKQCGPGGCKCADGYVRDTSTKKCVEQSECPSTGY